MTSKLVTWTPPNCSRSIQVSWDGPTARHRKALDAFYEAHPRSAEALFVTADTFEHGLAELSD